MAAAQEGAPKHDGLESPAVARGFSSPEKSEAAAEQPVTTESYPAWDEMKGTTDKAREELTSVQSVRAEAVGIRMRAQQVLDEAEALQEEAESIMAQARNAFAKAVVLNPRALRSMSNTVTALDEGMRTERHLRQGARQHAEEEADRARQKATDAILNSLSAVRQASISVQRELEEAKRASTTAEFLKESSRGDLKRAQTMLVEAESLMKQEARKLLSQHWARQIEPSRETAVPLPPQFQETLYRPPTEEPEFERQPASPPAIEPEELAPSLTETDQRPPMPVTAETPVNLPVPQKEAEPTPVMPDSGDKPPASQDQPAFASTEALESALNEFRRSIEKPEAVPTEEEMAESLPPQQAVEPKADTTSFQEQPSISQDQPVTASLDNLASALDGFLRLAEGQMRRPLETG